MSMNNFEVTTGQFSGPLEKLLELIEEKRLEITQVNLAEVTADFLAYMQTLGKDMAPRILSDFVVVASRLVLIKSKVLLPALELTQDEQESIEDLEFRLRLYKEFKKAGEHLNACWNKKHVALSRPLLSALGDTFVFYPPPKLAVKDLFSVMQSLVTSLSEFLPGAEKTIKQTAISMEKQMETLLARFQEAVTHSFKTLTKERSKGEVVVMFLAILHLLRDKLIDVEQHEQFSDIIVKKA